MPYVYRKAVKHAFAHSKRVIVVKPSLLRLLCEVIAAATAGKWGEREREGEEGEEGNA
jgi:hypothetical protein